MSEPAGRQHAGTSAAFAFFSRVFISVFGLLPLTPHPPFSLPLRKAARSYRSMPRQSYLGPVDTLGRLYRR